MPGARPVWRRRAVVVPAVAVVVLLVGWLSISFAAFNRPQLDRPTAADAVVVLGAPDAQSLTRAQQLLDAGISTRLVISTPGHRPRVCATPPAGVEVHCFAPRPSTTQGEAREIQRLATAGHWHNVVVVTWVSHISRSRLLIGRCYHGPLQMTSYRPDFSFGTWMYEYAYQSAGYVKAALTRHC